MHGGLSNYYLFIFEKARVDLNFQFLGFGLLSTEIRGACHTFGALCNCSKESLSLPLFCLCGVTAAISGYSGS